MTKIQNKVSEVRAMVQIITDVNRSQIRSEIAYNGHKAVTPEVAHEWYRVAAMTGQKLASRDVYEVLDALVTLGYLECKSQKVDESNGRDPHYSKVFGDYGRIIDHVYVLPGTGTIVAMFTVLYGFEYEPAEEFVDAMLYAYEDFNKLEV
jgi:hypothetical protein